MPEGSTQSRSCGKCNEFTREEDELVDCRHCHKEFHLACTSLKKASKLYVCDDCFKTSAMGAIPKITVAEEPTKRTPSRYDQRSQGTARTEHTDQIAKAIMIQTELLSRLLSNNRRSQRSSSQRTVSNESDFYSHEQTRQWIKDSERLTGGNPNQSTNRNVTRARTTNEFMQSLCVPKAPKIHSRGPDLISQNLQD